MTLEIFSTAQSERTYGIQEEEVKLFVNQLMKKNCGGGYSKANLKSKFFELSSNVITMMIMGKWLYGEEVEDVEEAKFFQNLMRELLWIGGTARNTHKQQHKRFNVVWQVAYVHGQRIHYIEQRRITTLSE